MPENYIAFAFYQIGNFNHDRDIFFWETILPRVKDQMKTLDRHTIKSLYLIIIGASRMQLQDNEFWETVEEQLIDNRLHRYLNIDQVCDLVEGLSLVGRGSDELLELCEKYIIKHRKALTKINIEKASHGFKELNKGSAVLFEVLGDPSRGLKQIE